MVGTIYVSMVLHSYILSVIFSALQVLKFHLPSRLLLVFISSVFHMLKFSSSPFHKSYL